MADRMKKIFGLAFAVGMIAGPAFAITPVQVPEPASMTILAAGGAGALGVHFARKWFKRK